MSLFQRVHRPPLLKHTNRFPLTSVLSKVFGRLVSVRLGRFMESSGVLPTTKFTYRKGLGTSDALLCMSHSLQSALESGQEARIAQIDFSEVFDRVNNQSILYKRCSVGIGAFVFSILRQYVMVDGCWSKLLKVMPGVQQGGVWASYCSSYTPRSFFPF